jgi:CubicO group peptidase (beta-lactamase class C family)
MRIAAVALAFLVTVSALAQDVATKADEYLSAWSNQGRFSGTVLIAKDGKVLLRKSYGMADMELGVPNTPETIYRIGSITKSFTALAILQLEAQKKLTVQDPVVKYVPGVPKAWQQITIQQLLTHVSGIPDFTRTTAYGKADDLMRIEHAVQELGAEPLVSAPGEKFAYSNSGYILLGRVIEKASGVSYEQYINENIIKPVGLENTAYDHVQPILKNRANGYVFDGDHLVNADMGDMSGTHSAGALHSTVDDLYKFDQALAGSKIFPSAMLDEAFQPRVKWAAPPPFNLDASYGYGWMSGSDFGHKYLMHGGWVNGFITEFTRYPADRLVIILASNIEGPQVIAIQQGLSAVVFGQPYEVPSIHKRVDVAKSILDRYVGTYHVVPGLDLKIFFDGDRLFAQGTNQPRFQMIPESETDFFFYSVESRVHMDVDASGKVKQLKVRVNGQDLVGMRGE